MNTNLAIPNIVNRQARRGARDAQRDIQVPLAPSPSRRVAKGPRHVLRPPWRGTTRRAMAPTNDLTPRCERRLRCASPSGRLAQPALAWLPRAPRLGASRLPCLVESLLRRKNRGFGLTPPIETKTAGKGWGRHAIENLLRRQGSVSRGKPTAGERRGPGQAPHRDCRARTPEAPTPSTRTKRPSSRCRPGGARPRPAAEAGTACRQGLEAASTLKCRFRHGTKRIEMSSVLERFNVPLQPPAERRRAEQWTPLRVGNSTNRRTPQA